MTAPFDIAIDFDKLRGFTPTIRPLADGLRASTAGECPSCAVIEYLAPNDERIFSSFPKGVASLGHLLHQCWAWQVFGDAAAVEVAIPWAHGVSHDDVVMPTGPWAGVYEVKTHSDPKPKAPSAANRRQCEFRMRLRELAGMTPPGPTRLVMIGKAGREGGMVRGPWEVVLTDERRVEIDAQLAAIDALMRRARSLDLHADAALREAAAGCTRCFPLPRVDASPGVSDLIDRALAAQEQLKPVKDAYEQVRDELKQRGLEPGQVIEGMQADLTISASGRMTIKRRYDAPAENFAAPF